mmetsp:Transcript_127178/g.220046  ORF Transcript_127178/g.220046 Transcript_127178/m.220046 type:complete len:462 (+) Transcript_127178:1294-2679(+)
MTARTLTTRTMFTHSSTGGGIAQSGDYRYGNKTCAPAILFNGHPNQYTLCQIVVYFGLPNHVSAVSACLSCLNSLDFLGSNLGHNAVYFFCAAEHGTSTDLQNGAQEARRNDNTADANKPFTFHVVLPKLLVDQTPDDSTQVTTSSNQTRNHSLVFRVYKWYNTKGGTLSSLHIQTEQDKEDHGQREDLCHTKDNHHTTSATGGYQQNPEAACNAVLGSSLVRRPTTKCTGKQIHQSEHRCDQTCGGLGQDIFSAVSEELFIQEQGCSIVDEEFNAEAAAVQEDQGDSVAVQHGLVEDVPLGFLASFFLDDPNPVTPLPLRAIIREIPNEETDQKEEECGNQQRQTPSQINGASHGLKQFENTRDECLHEASSQVAPTTSHGISSATDMRCKHLHGPELAGNKCCSSKTDEESIQNETHGIVDEGSASNRSGRDEQQTSHQSPRPQHIAQRANDDTSGDGC